MFIEGVLQDGNSFGIIQIRKEEASQVIKEERLAKGEL